MDRALVSTLNFTLSKYRLSLLLSYTFCKTVYNYNDRSREGQLVIHMVLLKALRYTKYRVLVFPVPPITEVLPYLPHDRISPLLLPSANIAFQLLTPLAQATGIMAGGCLERRWTAVPAPVPNRLHAPAMLHEPGYLIGSIWPACNLCVTGAQNKYLTLYLYCKGRWEIRVCME